MMNRMVNVPQKSATNIIHLSKVYGYKTSPKSKVQKLGAGPSEGRNTEKDESRKWTSQDPSHLSFLTQ